MSKFLGRSASSSAALERPSTPTFPFLESGAHPAAHRLKTLWKLQFRCSRSRLFTWRSASGEQLVVEPVPQVLDQVEKQCIRGISWRRKCCLKCPANRPQENRQQFSKTAAIGNKKPARVPQAKQVQARKGCAREHVKCVAPQHNHSGSSFG